MLLLSVNASTNRNTNVEDSMTIRFGKYRGWGAFKAYHPWAETMETLAIWALVIYFLLIIAQSFFTYFQMGELRGKFMAGAEQITCTRINWEEGFDCGGYYADIVEKRDEILASNGCFLMGRWALDTGKPDSWQAYIAGPVCWKPFPFGSVIEVSAGSVFDHH